MTNVSPALKALIEKRGQANAARKEYLERAAADGQLSGEDEAAYAKTLKDIDFYGKLIDDEVRAQKDNETRGKDLESLLRGVSNDNRGAGPDDEDKRSLAQRMRADLEKSRKGESTTGGVYQPIPDRRDLVVGTAAKGGDLVPVTLVNSLYQKLFDDSAILATNPTILRTESGEKMKLPRLSALGPVTQVQSRVAEAGPIIEGDPSFDAVELDAYKYAQFTQVSRELVEDSVLDIEALIGQVLGRNMANYVGLDLTTGSGTSQPRGVRTVVTAGGAARRVDSAAGGLFPTTDFDKFFDVIALLKPGYRRNGKWLVNDTAMFSLRKVKMGSVYAWEPNLQGAGEPDRFLGYPILTDPNIPAPGTAAGITAIFGDFSAYYVRFVRDVRVEWSMEYAWVNDLLSVKAVLRADGDAIDDLAFAGFNSIT